LQKALLSTDTRKIIPMRPIRSSTEYRRRSSGNVDSMNPMDPSRRRSVNLTHTNVQEVQARRFSLATHSDLGAIQGHPATRGVPFSFPSFILRRCSLPFRAGLSARPGVFKTRTLALSEADCRQQDLNLYRIKILVVGFVVILFIAILILFLPSSKQTQ
ncbi:unnamed protein product, partial [Lymnaea stagnalis]